MSTGSTIQYQRSNFEKIIEQDAAAAVRSDPPHGQFNQNIEKANSTEPRLRINSHQVQGSFLVSPILTHNEFQNQSTRPNINHQVRPPRSRSSSANSAAELFGSVAPSHSPNTSLGHKNDTNQTPWANTSNDVLETNGVDGGPNYFAPPSNTYLVSDAKNISNGNTNINSEEQQEDNELIESPALSTAVNLISSAATAIYSGVASNAIGGALRSTIEVGKNVIASTIAMDHNMKGVGALRAGARHDEKSPEKIDGIPNANELPSLAIAKANLANVATNYTSSVPSITSKMNPRAPFNLPLPSRKALSIPTAGTIRDTAKSDFDSTTVSTEKGHSSPVPKFRLPPPLRPLGFSPLTPNNRVGTTAANQSSLVNTVKDHEKKLDEVEQQLRQSPANDELEHAIDARPQSRVPYEESIIRDEIEELRARESFEFNGNAKENVSDDMIGEIVGDLTN